jgi:hypothetical protein
VIQKLLIKICELLQTELAGLITQPANQIVALPIPETPPQTLPLIGIYPGNLEINQNFKQSSSSQPTLQQIHQEINIDNPQPAVTYQLTQTPVKNSIICHLVIEKQKILLQEDTDFNIDDQQGTITFVKNLAKVNKILLDYSYMSVCIIREFSQDFLVDILDSNLKNIEKFSSLISGMILTNHDELIADYNFPSQVTQYQSNQILTVHSISHIDFINGSYSNFLSSYKLQLKFQTKGQIKVTKAVRDSVLPIQTIQIQQNIN